MKSFKQFLSEMSADIGEIPSPYESSTGRRQAYYNDTSDILPSHEGDWKHVKKIGTKSLKARHEDGHTVYAIDDDNEGQRYGHAIIRKDGVSTFKDVPHEMTSDVARSRTGIPKGIITDIVYNHFKKSAKPLASSGYQSVHGHGMWRKLAKRALDDGHHVYHLKDGELIKLDHDNLEDELNSTWQDEGDKVHRHIVLSKHPL